MLIRRTAALCLLFVLASSIAARAQDSKADQHFKQIYTDDWAWRRSSNGPATDDDGEGRARGVRPHLPKVDLATQEAKLQHQEQVLRELDTIDVKQLSPANQVNYEVFRPQIEVLLNQQKFKDYEKPLS